MNFPFQSLSCAVLLLFVPPTGANSVIQTSPPSLEGELTNRPPTTDISTGCRTVTLEEGFLKQIAARGAEAAPSSLGIFTK
jgi:hypothetical protein